MSPFAPWTNSILYIPIQSGELVADPQTGNQVPDASVLQITAILNTDFKKFEKNQEPQDYPGQDVNEIYVQGYLIDPMFFPENISFPLSCRAKIGDSLGILRIPLLIPSSYNSQQYTGAKIVGYFQKED